MLTLIAVVAQAASVFYVLTLGPAAERPVVKGVYTGPETCERARVDYLRGNPGADVACVKRVMD